MMIPENAADRGAAGKPGTGGRTRWPRPAATGPARQAGSGPPAHPEAAGTATAGQPGIRIPPFVARGDWSVPAAWPLQDSLELGAFDSAVPWARLHARHVLGEWGLASLGDSAELIVTELITNAVTASRALAQALPVRLWLASDLAWLLIAVGDPSTQPPVRLDTGDDSESGRGLILVEAMSSQWGWFRRRPGKYVWALL